MLPEVLDAVKGATRMQDSGGGLAKRGEIAELFDVENVLVGRARYNSAKKGQAAVILQGVGKERWRRSRVAEESGTIRSITFGMSFQEMMKQTQSMLDSEARSKGSRVHQGGLQLRREACSESPRVSALQRALRARRPIEAGNYADELLNVFKRRLKEIKRCLKRVRGNFPGPR